MDDLIENAVKAVNPRPIKFRAWDTKDNCMVSWKKLKEFGFDAFGYAMDCPDRLILMQYTNWNDICDVEIYDGDIIGCPIGANGVVSWKDSGWHIDIIEPKLLGGYSVSYLIECHDQIKKLLFRKMGNIHQSPKLLEVQL